MTYCNIKTRCFNFDRRAFSNEPDESKRRPSI